MRELCFHHNIKTERKRKEWPVPIFAMAGSYLSVCQSRSSLGRPGVILDGLGIHMAARMRVDWNEKLVSMRDC